jgi:ABC-2 type transport system ATP-binding protein
MVLTITYDGAAPPGLGDLAGRADVSRVEIVGDQVRIFARALDGLLGAAVKAGAGARVAVSDVTTSRPSLESVFLTLTGRDYRE